MNSNSTLVITIDGPAASGKGTIADLLAKRMGLRVLHSGMLYRRLAFLLLQHCIVIDEDVSITNFLLSHLASVGQEEGWSDEEIERMMSDEVSKTASIIAVIPGVRRILLDLQRKEAYAPGLVAEGRDMGTQVFPQAQVKIYLTADVMIRGKRRWEQLKEQGIFVTLKEVLSDLETRDKRDASRQTAPLKPADDARIIDASELTVEQALDKVMDVVTVALTG